MNGSSSGPTRPWKPDGPPPQTRSDRKRVTLFRQQATIETNTRAEPDCQGVQQDVRQKVPGPRTKAGG